MTTENAKEQVLLDPEFEHEPVPVSHRKSLISLASVWFGFPMVLTSAVFGGMVVGFLGFKMGSLAILVGNLCLFLFVGLLSYRAGSTGMNFALMAQRSFGKTGYIVVSGLLSTVVVGWFAFQVGLTGATMRASFGSNEFLMTLLGGILFLVITYIGIKALSILGWIAAPLYAVLGIVAIIYAFQSGTSGIWNYSGATNAGAFSFGAAVSLIFAAFADSGTMTADFTRWAKDGRQGLLAAMSAFPTANFFAQIVGGIIVATGVIANPTVDGGNFMLVLTDHGTLLTILSVLFVFINLGSVCTHCLYNGAVGWSFMTKSKMRTMTIILGIIGIIAALAGVWSLLLDWLNLLGIVVPPIGTIIIMDQLVLQRKNDNDIRTWQPEAFITWAIASVVALLVNFYAPEYSVSVSGIVAAAIIYPIISKRAAYTKLQKIGA